MEFRKPYISYSDKHVQNFDREKMTITKGGETYNIYDRIQVAAEDTDIEQCLIKYGTLKPLELNAQQLYGDFTGAMDLRNIMDRKIELEKIFLNMPLADRKAFNNDLREFIEHGEQYLLEKIGEENVQNKQPNSNTTTESSNTRTESTPNSSK